MCIHVCVKIWFLDIKTCTLYLVVAHPWTPLGRVSQGWWEWSTTLFYIFVLASGIYHGGYMNVITACPKSKRVIFLYWRLYNVHNTLLACPISGNCYFLVFQNACPNLTFIWPGQLGKCFCSTLGIFDFSLNLHVSVLSDLQHLVVDYKFQLEIASGKNELASWVVELVLDAMRFKRAVYTGMKKTWVFLTFRFFVGSC